MHISPKIQMHPYCISILWKININVTDKGWGQIYVIAHYFLDGRHFYFHIYMWVCVHEKVYLNIIPTCMVSIY